MQSQLDMANKAAGRYQPTDRTSYRTDSDHELAQVRPSIGKQPYRRTTLSV